MRTTSEIRHELQRATARRAELWRALGRGEDDAQAELAELNAQIDRLWDELRSTRTRERFGDPQEIVRRAERENRLDRELERRYRPSERRAA